MNSHHSYHKLSQTIELFPEQCLQAWQEVLKLKLPRSLRKINRIIVVGMGGSALGPHIVKSLLRDDLKIPFEIVNDYNFSYAPGRKTLIVLSSYSGTTEETISAFQQARHGKNSIFIISTGGLLAKLAKRDNLPCYIFDPIFNPSAQPRMGLGYNLFAFLALFRKLGLIDITTREIKLALKNIKLKTLNKRAEDYAKKLKKKIPVMVASEHLAGSAHAVSNMINESPKHLCFWLTLPEMDHHLLEGLRFPRGLKKNFIFLFFKSDLYHSRTWRRYSLTAISLKRQGVGSLTFMANQTTKLGQILETVIFGGYLSYHLSMANKVNPLKIPQVDYFKKALKR